MDERLLYLDPVEPEDLPASGPDDRMIAERLELCAAHVTLDGKPAKIIGARLSGAIIFALDAPAEGVEFAWPTVARIVANGGAFRR